MGWNDWEDTKWVAVGVKGYVPEGRGVAVHVAAHAETVRTYKNRFMLNLRNNHQIIGEFNTEAEARAMAKLWAASQSRSLIEDVGVVST